MRIVLVLGPVTLLSDALSIFRCSWVILVLCYITASCNTWCVVDINKATFASNRVSVLCLINILLSTIIISYILVIVSSFWRLRKLLLFFPIVGLIIMISSSPWYIITINLLRPVIKLLIIGLINIFISTAVSIFIFLYLPRSFLISHFLLMFKSPLFMSLIPYDPTCLLTTSLCSTSIIASVTCWWNLI